MGAKVVRKGPARLAEKLKQIRENIGASQSEMVIRLGAQELINRTHIANYERGEREPILLVLLKYAQLANIYVDALIDDQVDLPNQIPSAERSAGIEPKS